MNSTTLRGVFPDPKPVHRRNFIKENVRQIKQMQGLLQDAGFIQPRNPKEDRFRNVPKTVVGPAKELRLRSMSQESGLRARPEEKNKRPKVKTATVGKFTHRAMQTEKTDDINKLYENGVIKFARVKEKNGAKRGQGDGPLTQSLDNLDLNDKEERDFVRENIKHIRPKYVKPQAKKPTTPNYEPGQLPKYIKDKKEEDAAQAQLETEDCPPGYVLLPEEDRKTTLRNLRQSYADRIQELNTMPVRSDTLRMRRRKMEIEEELKKIDGGIKIFQRPKVYVKIND